MKNNIPHVFLVLFFFLFLLNKGKAQDKKYIVVSSASMFTDMASNLVTDDFELQTIVPIGGDPHKYKARPSDARKVLNANLILVNGLTFEGWIKELIENSGTKANIKTITEGIKAIESLQYENSSDPHAWMDASNGLKYIENIRDALVLLAPEHTEEIEANYIAYREKLVELDQNIFKEIEKIPLSQRVLITSHDAFQYYGQRYKVKLEAIMGISTEAEAQTSDIIRVSKSIKENNVPAIFIESTINPKMLKQIASDNDVKIGGELFADSLGDEESVASTYIDMLWSNTVTMVKALSEKVVPKEELISKEEKPLGPSFFDEMPKSLKLIFGIVMFLMVLMVFISKRKKL